MAANTYDILIEQGATWSIQFNWKDYTGALFDLSTYTARMQIRPSKDSDIVMAELSSVDNSIICTAMGEIHLTLSADKTSLIESKGVYDLELVSPLGIVTRLVEGKVILSKEVTR